MTPVRLTHRLAAVLLFTLSSVAAASTTPLEDIRTALNGGDLERATAAADRALAAANVDAQALWWAGRAYGRKAATAGMLSAARWATRARDAFEQAVALDPSHVRARYDLLEYYLQAPRIVGGGRDKADAQAVLIATHDAAMGKLAAARLARADDDPARAETLIREALALDPLNIITRPSLAAIATEREDWAAVRELWLSQLQVPVGADDGSAHALARYQLARTAAISGNHLDEALAAIDRFISDGDTPAPLTLASAQWRRGQILARLGRRDEAVAALRSAVDDPGVGDQAEDDLERLLGE